VQHLGVLGTDTVKLICLWSDEHAFFVVFGVGCGVEECELKFDGAVEVVEEVAPTFKDGGLVLVLCNLIIDVTKLQGFGVELIAHMADTVGENMTVRDTVLCRFYTFGLIIRPLHRTCDALFFCPCELYFLDGLLFGC